MTDIHRDRCAALTYQGEWCRCRSAYRVRVGDRVVPLCGGHARSARRGVVALWEPDRPPAGLSAHRDAWTAADDAVLSRLDATPVAELARRFGRTISAVQQRRNRLRLLAREEEEEQQKEDERLGSPHPPIISSGQSREIEPASRSPEHHRVAD